MSTAAVCSLPMIPRTARSPLKRSRTQLGRSLALGDEVLGVGGAARVADIPGMIGCNWGR